LFDSMIGLRQTDINRIDQPKGMPREKPKRMFKFKDSSNFYSGVDKLRHDLRGMSPLEFVGTLS